MALDCLSSLFSVADAGRAELARWIGEPMTGRGSSLADNRTRDLAVKIRAAAFGDVRALHDHRQRRTEVRRVVRTETWKQKDRSRTG